MLYTRVIETGRGVVLLILAISVGVGSGVVGSTDAIHMGKGVGT
jgi:hypothetical protein